MKYNYNCKNEECPNMDKVIEIEKPMQEGGNPEDCENCGKEMSKIYGSTGIRTFGDGAKI